MRIDNSQLKSLMESINKVLVGEMAITRSRARQFAKGQEKVAKKIEALEVELQQAQDENDPVRIKELEHEIARLKEMSDDQYDNERRERDDRNRLYGRGGRVIAQQPDRAGDIAYTDPRSQDHI